MYKILDEGQGLWETLASMTYPQLLLIWLKISIRTWKTATMTRMSSKMQNYFIVTYVQLPFRICLVQLSFFFKIIKQI
jgi:hypothetical protein